MLLYEGYKGTTAFSYKHHGVNLYNWPNFLDNAIRGLNYYNERAPGKQHVFVYTSIDKILTGGEDGRVHYLKLILARMRELIDRYAQPDEKETIAEQYALLCTFVDQKSNQHFGAATIDFCLRYLALNAVLLKTI